jgi:hypothetical protein
MQAIKHAGETGIAIGNKLIWSRHHLPGARASARFTHLPSAFSFQPSAFHFAPGPATQPSGNTTGDVVSDQSFALSSHRYTRPFTFGPIFTQS